MKKVQVSTTDKNWQFVIEEDEGRLYIQDNGARRSVDLIRLGRNRYSLIIDGRSHEIGVDGSFEGYTIFSGSRSGHFLVEDYEIARIKKAAGIEDSVKQLNVSAPMPGLIVRLHCQPGDQVAKNQSLMVMEAMKMENDIKSPTAGVLKSISVTVGDNVEKGQALAEFE